MLNTVPENKVSNAAIIIINFSLLIDDDTFQEQESFGVNW